MNKIKTLEELSELCTNAEHVKLYGAGLKLASFMEMIKEMKMPLPAECILVSSAKGNPAEAFGLPVVELQKAAFHPKDVILLTISECFLADVEKLLALYGVTEHVYEIDYSMVDIIPYRKVYQAVEPFVAGGLWKKGSFNHPVQSNKRYVWSCWWQGVENAPELVKKCWESQRRHIPTEAEHVIITWDNCRDYIELPAYVIQKAQKGELLPAHLADIARCSLLYRYGGIWLDATVYLTDSLPERCFSYEILSRSTGEGIYCTNVSWVTWFLGAVKGEELYRFMMEAFFYVLKNGGEICHYYMIDFLIAIACREIPGVEQKMQKIPVNNVNAVQLQKHLKERFTWELYRTCTKGAFLQKLTYKGGGYQNDSLYRHLIDTRVESEAAHEEGLRDGRDYL